MNRSLQHEATGIVKAAQDVIATVTVFIAIISIPVLVDIARTWLAGY